MSALTYRRRWLLIRPWVQDTLIACGFIATVMGAMYGLDHLAEYCTAMGFCS